jgi:small nuclear ribonucleoprotein (snRNP)-like protein
MATPTYSSSAVDAAAGRRPLAGTPHATVMAPLGLALAWPLFRNPPSYPPQMVPLSASSTSPSATPTFVVAPIPDLMPVRVLLHDGQLVRGTLVAFDHAMSPVLHDYVELHPQVGCHMPRPLVFPRAVIASQAIEPSLSPSPPSSHVGVPPIALSAHPVAYPPSPSPTDWVVDSGASFHTTSTASSLFHSHPPHP